MTKSTAAGLALAIAMGGVAPKLAHAGQQMIAGKRILIRNADPGGDVSRRKIIYFAKETPSDAILGGAAGDPTVGGAKIKVKVDAQEQCFPMPASHWSSFSTAGFLYKDPGGVNGPVKKAFIRRTAGGGVFLNKVAIVGASGPGPQPHITILPPGTQASANFTIGGGDQYCTTFGASTVTGSTTTLFKAKNSPEPGPPCAATACP